LLDRPEATRRRAAEVSAGTLRRPAERASLRDYLRVLLRHRVLVIVAAVAAPAAAVVISLQQTPRYEASAEVLLSRENLASMLTGTTDPTVYQQADRVAETQAQLARVPIVAQRTLDAAGVKDRTAEQLLENSKVTAATNADLLEFAVTDEDPATAVKLASGYARQFTRYRLELDTAAIARARSEVDLKIQELEAEGDKSSSLYTSLVEKDQQLRTLEALQTSNAYVVRNADVAQKVAPRPVRNGLLGFGLGLVLGIALAFLREALDTRVRTAEEVASVLGLPLLARLPEPPRALRRRRQLVMLGMPSGVHAEAFRLFRTNLDFVNLGRDARVIMFTSAIQAEGKSTTVANLAVALARAGRQVALVDLDLRRPTIAQFFGLDGKPGITDVALGNVPPEQAIHRIDVSRQGGGPMITGGGLEVLTSGPLPPDVGEFVSTRALASMLRFVRDRADIVLVDAPPLLKVGDALALSARVDALVVVTRLNVLRRGMLAELARLLAASPAEKLGFVATDPAGDEGYGYGYGYGYEPYGAAVTESTAA
jgi:succinoglycan biosynthesis transport protein ExoP